MKNTMNLMYRTGLTSLLGLIFMVLGFQNVEARVRATNGADALEDRVVITWPKRTEANPEAYHYQVRRGAKDETGKNSGTLLSVVSHDNNPDGDIHKYEDFSGDPGTVYSYIVVKVDVNAESKEEIGANNGSREIAPPTDLVATFETLEDQVLVEWNDNSNIEDGYVIQRRKMDQNSFDNNDIVADSLKTEFSEDKSNVFVDKNVTFFRDMTAQPGQEYTYRVRAYTNSISPNVIHTSNLSDTDNGKRGAINAPSSVLATDGRYSDRVVITWVDETTTEIRYKIYRIPNSSIVNSALPFVDNNNTFLSDLVTWDWSPTDGYSIQDIGKTYTFNDLMDDANHSNSPTLETKYTYGVQAIGNNNAASIIVTNPGRVGGLRAPKNVSATDKIYDDRVVITWEDIANREDNSEDGFVISRGSTGNEIARVNRNSTSYTDRDPQEGQTTYYVAAYTEPQPDENNGSISAYVNDLGEASDVLAPRKVTATDGDYEDKVVIGWESDATKAVMFNVYRRQGNGGTFTRIHTASADTREVTDRNIIAGEEYTYKVKAVNAVGTESEDYDSSIALAEDNLDKGRRELSVPTNVKASDYEVGDDGYTETGFEDRVVITWDDVSEKNTGYRIYRSEVDGANDTQDILIADMNNSTAETFTDRTGVPGKTYAYVVRAYDEENVGSSPSPHSGESQTPFVNASDVGAADDNDGDEWDLGSRDLNPPTNVKATDGEFEKDVVITWEDKSLVEDGYAIYEVINNSKTLIGKTQKNKRSFTHSFTKFINSPISNDEAISYRVVTFQMADNLTVGIKGAKNLSNIYGNNKPAEWESSVNSNKNQDTGFTLFLKPRSFKASNSYLDKIVLTWVDASNIETGYKIFRKESTQKDSEANWKKIHSGLLKEDTETFTDEQKNGIEDLDRLKTGVTYDYKIVAVKERSNDTGGEEGGRVVSKQTLNGTVDFVTAPITTTGRLANLAKPGILQVSTKYRDRIVLTWPDRANNEWGYKVWRKLETDDSQDYELIKTLGPNAETYTDKSSDLVENNRDLIKEKKGAKKDDVITWNEKADVIWYLIEEEGNNGNFKEIDEVDATRTSYKVPQDGTYKIWAVSSREYQYRVAPYIGTDDVIPKRDESRTSIGKLGRSSGENLDPEAERFTEIEASDGTFATQILVEWNDETGHEKGFVVRRDGKEIASLPANTTSFSDPDAIPGQIHNYEVTWRRPEQKRDLVLEVEKTGADGDNRRLTWKDRGDADHYEIYRNNSLIDASFAGTPYIDRGRPGNPDYKVKAVLPEVEISLGSDYGRREPNGNISGRITSIDGAGVEGVEICIDPLVSRALYFDGTGGYVDMGHFPVPDAFTLAFWVNPSVGGKTQTMVANGKVNDASANFRVFMNNDDKLEIKIGDDPAITGGKIIVGDWNYITIVKDGRNVKAYNGKEEILDENLSSSGDFNSKKNLWTLGMWRKDQEPRAFLNGRLDEVRMWRGVRTLAEIKADRDRILNAQTEPDLLAYWPVEDSRHSAIANLVPAGNYGEFSNGVYRVDDVAPFDICAVTDKDGNYNIPGIRYGEQTRFKVRPQAKKMQFQPTFKALTLNQEHTVENEVNFTDISSYTVSGRVVFPRSDDFDAICPAPNVQILVNDEIKTVTDKDGIYSLTVSGGEGLRIRAQYPDDDLKSHQRREFEKYNSETNENIDGDVWVYPNGITDDISGVDFRDVTLRRLTVRVGAGCDKPIGTAVIQIRDESGCFVTELKKNEDFNLWLPSQKYFLAVSKIEDIDSDFPVALRANMLQFFENLGWQEVDFSSLGVPNQTEGADDSDLQNVLDEGSQAANDNAGSGESANDIPRQKLNATVDFIYRAPLRVSFTFAPADESCLPTLDALVLKQGDPLLVSIKVDEYYGEELGSCPADTGKVTIFDEVSDLEGTPIEIPISQGEAVYSTVVQTPNVTRGRVDAKGNIRDYQKAFSVTAEVLGQKPVQKTQWVVVTGERPRVGTFTSYQFHEMPLMVLRDPPGDGSSSSIEKGETVSMKLGASFGETIGFALKFEGGIEIKPTMAITTVPGTPLIASEVKSLEIKAKKSLTVNPEYSYTDSDELSISLSFSEKISTSSSDDIIGEDADVFIGLAPNLVFAKTDVISINDRCLAVRTESIAADLNSEETRYYVYTGHQIKNVIIPQLEELLGDNVKKEGGGTPKQKEVEEIEESIANWQMHLDMNQKFKDLAGEEQPYSAEVFEGIVDVDLDNDYDSEDDFYPSDHSNEFDRKNGNLKLNARNDNDVVGRVLKRTGVNRAFSAGAPFEYSENFQTSDGYSWENSGKIKVEPAFEEIFSGLTITEEFSFTISGGDTKDNGHTISYTLDDDDIGDYISVDVATDTRFGTPVFKNVIGRTSEPWEPWFKDPTLEGDELIAVSNLGTQRRSMVQLLVEPNERLMVPSGKSATFTLTMSNLTESDEERDYIISTLPQFNPGGAIIRVNGRPISAGGGVLYEIGPLQSQEITLTIDRGPRQAVYENLAIMALSGGETETQYVGEGDFIFRPGISDTAFVSVEFLPSSSPVTLSLPHNGWVYGAARVGSPIQIDLTDFNIAVSKGDSLDRIVTQYRPKKGSVGENERLDGIEKLEDWTIIDFSTRQEILAVPGNDNSIPGSGGITYLWDVSDVPDGVYELRAYTEYQTDTDSPTTMTEYSKVITGTIDRSAPQVFGTPEPADGILSLGESISITFHEPIKCSSNDVTLSFAMVDDDTLVKEIRQKVLQEVVQEEKLDAAGNRVLDDSGNPEMVDVLDANGNQVMKDVKVNGNRVMVDVLDDDGNPVRRFVEQTKTKLNGKVVIDAVAFDMVCDGKTLILTPHEGQDLEGKQLIAEVKNLTDGVGNPISNPVQWVFGVRQDAFIWRQTALTASVETGQMSMFDAEIVNGTSAVADFTLDVPDWLMPSVSSARLPQGEAQTIQFAVRQNLADGVYRGNIKAVNKDGSEAKLKVKLIVVPNWQLDPSQFEHAMTVIARVKVPDNSAQSGFSFSDDTNDQVAAFVGSELRGVGKISEMGGEHFAFLTVYSNQMGSESVRFKVWDDSEGIPYEAKVTNNSVTLPFVANTMVGAPGSPQNITAIEDASNLPLVQEIVLNAGWTWFSSLVKHEGTALNDALASLTPDNGDVLQSQSASANFNGTSWASASGVTLRPGRGYAIKMAKADTLVFEGDRVAFDTPIALQNGWNWIGFTDTEPIAIDDALKNLDAKNNDWILSQNGFAQFDAATDSWWGSLTALEPGDGYRLFMFQPKQNSFEYAWPTDPSTKPLLATKPVLAKGAPDWSVDDRAYPHQMAVVAKLNVEGASTIDPTDMIGAFVGDELRGMAQPVVIPGQDAPVAFLMVHGVTADETIQFRVFDADRSEILTVADEIGFEVDKAVGSVASPVVLNARLVRTPDFNADGTVAFADFLMFSQMFGKDQDDDGFDGRFDLNDDGAVNFPDFVVFSQAFGNPVAAKTAMSSASFDMSKPGVNEKVQLSLHPKPGTKSDEVHVMVRVADAEALQGYGFRVVYDPSVLTFVSATSANPSQFATNLAPALAVNNIPGELLLADMLDMEAEGESDLVQLTFQSLDGNAGSFIEILDAMVSDRVGALNELLGVHLDDVRPIPSDFGLAQNRPNPFNPETVIDYQLPEAGDVLLVIYNVLGQEVVRLVQAHQVAGYYHITWDGRDESRRQVSSGVYFYRLMMGDVGFTHKMVLLK